MAAGSGSETIGNFMIPKYTKLDFFTISWPQGSPGMAKQVQAFLSTPAKKDMPQCSWDEFKCRCNLHFGPAIRSQKLGEMATPNWIYGRLRRKKLTRSEMDEIRFKGLCLNSVIDSVVNQMQEIIKASRRNRSSKLRSKTDQASSVISGTPITGCRRSIGGTPNTAFC
uniref:Uncharacterized protein n=1 Tax=Solanum demissum TaxID=50514 RepID=Q6L4B9_SOLDE|nr:hypothetical protein SDM1_19t00004 [Solanum demissum]